MRRGGGSGESCSSCGSGLWDTGTLRLGRGEEEGEGKGAGEEEGEPEEGSPVRSRETLAVLVPLGDFRFSISLPFGISKLCGACAPAERSDDSAWRLPNDASFSSRATGQPQAQREHRAQISRELHSKPSALPPTHFSLPFSTPPLFPTGNATPSSYSSARQFLDSCLPSRAGE